MTNHYQVLGVPQNATSEQIKAAYREFAKHFHPDMHQNSEFFKRRFQEVQKAYEVLSDATSRKAFDKKLDDLKSNPSDLAKIKELNSKVEELNRTISVEKMMTQRRREQYDTAVMENIELHNKIKSMPNTSGSSYINDLNNFNYSGGNRATINLTMAVIALSIFCLCFILSLTEIHNNSTQIADTSPTKTNAAPVNMVKIYNRMKALSDFESYNAILILGDSLIKSHSNIDTSSSATHRNEQILEKADYFTIRGYGKMQTSNDTGAIRDYTLSILNHKIPNPQPFIGRADVKLKLGDVSGAFKDINNAIYISPKLAGARQVRGNMFYDKKQYLLALNDYKVGALAKPNDASFSYMVGECYFNIHKIDSACIYWRKAGDFGSKEAFERISKFCK